MIENQESVGSESSVHICKGLCQREPLKLLFRQKFTCIPLVDFMLLPFILGPNSLTSECLGRSEKLAENRRPYIKEVKESHKMCKDKSAHACIRQLSFSRLNGAWESNISIFLLGLTKMVFINELISNLNGD
jgi:hypothetical protein